MTKTCSRCKLEKPVAEYSRCASAKDGLQHRCKACALSAWAEYRARNPGRVAASKAADYEANAEAYKARAKSRYEQNRDAVKSKTAEYQKANKAKKAQWSSRYVKENKEAFRIYSAKRLAVKLQAIPRWANTRAIGEFYKLAVRLTNETGIQYHVDHIVPLQSQHVCGLHCEANLQVITGSENCSKHNRYWPDMPDPCPKNEPPEATPK